VHAVNLKCVRRECYRCDTQFIDTCCESYISTSSVLSFCVEVYVINLTCAGIYKQYIAMEAIIFCASVTKRSLYWDDQMFSG